MVTDLRLQFGEFALDQRNACLWRGLEVLKLKPKAFDVLRYLVEHTGQLVSKDDLWRAIWPDVAVTDGVLAVCLTEIRQALGDDAKAPRFIETVHRRGYRFIAVVTRRSDEPVFQFEQPADSSPPLPFFSSPAPEGRPESPPLASLTTTVGSLDEALRPCSGQAPRNPGKKSETETTERESESHTAQFSSLDEAQRNPGEEENLYGTRGFFWSDPRPQTLDISGFPTPSRFTRSVVLAAVPLLIIIVLTVQYLSRPSLSTQSSVLVTEEAKPSSLPLPDKPSLIVLPLVNLSGDPEQEYFSDGLTEVLTGDLSKISSLFVIARNSAFTYKGKATKVQDVSKETGVRYVLEGSVQRAGQRIRIAVQLIDAKTGYHLWSQQYDRPLQDIFALQDEIVQKIVATLKLQLTLEEQGVIVRKHTDNLDAYDAYLRGEQVFYRFTKEDLAQARQMYEKALALDPHYVEMYATLGLTYCAATPCRWRR